LPLGLHLQDEELLRGTQWNQELCRLLNKPGWKLTDVLAWAGGWFAALQEQESSLRNAARGLNSGMLLSGDLFDALPHNLFVANDGSKKFFDQEWQLSREIELGYLVFRAVFSSLGGVQSCARPSPSTPVLVLEIILQTASGLGIPLSESAITRYVALEREHLICVYGLDNPFNLRTFKELCLPVRPDLRYIAPHFNALQDQDRQRRQARRNSTVQVPAKPFPRVSKKLEEIAKFAYWSATLQLRARLRRRRAARQLLDSKLFDPEFYLAQYPDVAAAGVNPLAHFLASGAAEGRDPNPYFDTAYYLSSDPAVAANGMNPLLHYLLHGFKEGCEPSAYFSGRLYYEWNPDVRDSGMNPLSHYLKWGRAQGRRAPIVAGR
jgi:hypothetical protein